MMQCISLLALSTLALLNFSGVHCKATVPSDLSSAFDPNSIALQVSFDDQSDNGIPDGSTVGQRDASNTPTFALGDSSGVNTDISFLIMMIDTTTNNRVLHYMQGDFQATEDKTAIASSAKPLLAYKAPGTLGDTGSTRDYTFLMYQQKDGFKASDMPSLGSTFDIKSFMSSSGLDDALAGIAMSVQVSGGSNSAASSQGAASSTAQSTAQQTTTAATPASPSTTIVAPAQPSVVSQATSASAALPSTLATAVPTNDIASIATGGNPGGLVSGLSTAVVSAASVAASGASNGASSVVVGASGATATNSSASTQTSNVAVSNRGKAFASLPILVFAGVFLV